MPVESASYISDLNASYPASTDGVKEGDDHVRLIKSVLKSTFPNLTGAVTAVQGSLNNPILTSTPAADTVPYYTSGGAATASFTAFGRSVVATANAAAARSLLSVPEASTVVSKGGDTMTGTLVVPALQVNSTAPRIYLNDTDWGVRSVYSESGLVGFLSSTGSWSWYVDNAGNVLNVGTLTVSGAASLNSTLSVGSSASVAGALSVGGSITSSGNITAAGNVTAYSDARLKIEATPVHDALGRLSKLHGYEYTRVDTLKKEIGVIAQEVATVFPELVNTDGEYLSVAYGNFVGVLIECINHLSERVAELEAKSNCSNGDCGLRG